ncbi:MAG: hypothetical protein B9S33_04280, partial [Pedosphaera sp. Tous-C6FEB]
MERGCVADQPQPADLNHAVAGNAAAAGASHTTARTSGSPSKWFALFPGLFQECAMFSSMKCQLLAAFILSVAAPEAVYAQAAKAKSAPVIPRYDPPDQPFRMAPMPQSTRSIVVPLATNLHLAFDTALLRTHTVWSGRGLALLGPQYGLPKSPFISTN